MREMAPILKSSSFHTKVKIHYPVIFCSILHHTSNSLIIFLEQVTKNCKTTHFFHGKSRWNRPWNRWAFLQM